jgi:hypothetical protein
MFAAHRAAHREDSSRRHKLRLLTHMLKNARNHHLRTATAIAKFVTETVDSAPSRAKMATVKDSLSDLDFQIQIGLVRRRHVRGVFIPSVGTPFEPAKLFRGYVMRLPKPFQRDIFAELCRQSSG